MIRLEKPHIKYEKSYRKAVDECKAFKGDDFAGFYADLARIGKTKLKDFPKYVDDLLDEEHGLNFRKWGVPTTELWIIDSNDEYVGKMDIRHQPVSCAGHIGGFVIPSKAGGIYASVAVKAAIEYAKSIGINEIIVTCHASNKASKRGVEKLVEIYNGKRIDDHIDENITLERYLLYV